jgi:sterol desaturase/sphingolipid hydroxylase (fatty acid hydroxylase superfamily)
MLESIAAALASLVILAAVFVPLERLFPARKQRTFRKSLALDVCFFFGQYFVWNAAAFAVLAWLRPFVHVGSLRAPLILQAAVAIVLGDVLVYWFHRACHRFDFLWRFHAVHHSAEELDWLAAHREHPVDGIGTMFFQNLPAMALGVPMHVLAGVVVFRACWAIFVHSNVRVPLGPLRWVLGSPELHHWHHARVSRHNFANLAPWIDWVFGTHKHPEGAESYALGLDEPYPQTYIGQLLRPFRIRLRATRPSDRAAAMSASLSSP